MFYPKGKRLAYNSTNLPNLSIIFPNFFPPHFIPNLDYPISQWQASLDVCAHIPSTLWVFTPYIVFMTTNALEPMMQFMTLLPPLREMLTSMWDKNKYMHFLQPHLSPLVKESTMCLLKMAFAHANPT
jgi:hypothetical protein